MSLLPTYGIKPQFWTYRVSNKELDSAFSDILLKRCKILKEIQLCTSVHEEIYTCLLYIDEDWIKQLSEEEKNDLSNAFVPGMTIDEDISSFQSMLNYLFGQEVTYSLLDYSDGDFVFTIEVNVPLSEISKMFI